MNLRNLNYALINIVIAFLKFKSILKRTKEINKILQIYPKYLKI